jgi:hypothetical protein
MLCKPLSPATLAAGAARYAAYSDPDPNPSPNPSPTPSPEPHQARYAAYSESAATMVHVEALQAAARLQATARGADAAHFGELQAQLAPYSP